VLAAWPGFLAGPASWPGSGVRAGRPEPVAFGSHRKPEAILIPYETYERYEALARQSARLEDVLSAAQSVQVELPGAFSPEHDREVSAYYRR
jgi:hypothetical protein